MRNRGIEVFSSDFEAMATRYDVLELMPVWQLSYDPEVYETRNASLGLLAPAQVEEVRRETHSDGAARLPWPVGRSPCPPTARPSSCGEGRRPGAVGSLVAGRTCHAVGRLWHPSRR